MLEAITRVLEVTQVGFLKHAMGKKSQRTTYRTLATMTAIDVFRVA